MILHIENPKDISQNLLGFINEFSKVVGYISNTQKPIAFPYTDNKRSKREIRKQSYLPFHWKEENT